MMNGNLRQAAAGASNPVTIEDESCLLFDGFLQSELDNRHVTINREPDEVDAIAFPPNPMFGMAAPAPAPMIHLPVVGGNVNEGDHRGAGDARVGPQPGGAQEAPMFGSAAARRPLKLMLIGRDLRNMADDFARQRGQEISAQADEINVEAFTLEDLRKLIQTVFVDSNNFKERVVALFLFLAELVIRAFQKHGFSIFRRMYDIAAEYVRTVITPTVEQHGGWSAIINPIGRWVQTGCVVLVGCYAIGCAWKFLNQ